jgi:hypothetical protein
MEETVFKDLDIWGYIRKKSDEREDCIKLAE